MFARDPHAARRAPRSWSFGLACLGVLLSSSKPGQAAERERAEVPPISASAGSEAESAAPSKTPPPAEAAQSPTTKPVEPAGRRTPPTAWYVSEFVTGVSFATMQVALVWAIVDHDEPTKRDRALIVSGVAAVTALAALGTAALVLASDNGKQPRATAYVGFGTVGVRASF
jgi:hypothetical protein